VWVFRNIKSKENKKIYEEKKRKRVEEINKKEKEKRIRVMGEVAFKEW
jgi:hypothetical protein